MEDPINYAFKSLICMAISRMVFQKLNEISSGRFTTGLQYGRLEETKRQDDESFALPVLLRFDVYPGVDMKVYWDE